MSAFIKCSAFERLKIVAELPPKLRETLSAVSRPMRNKVGHFGADYDPCSGDLVLDDGNRVNYITFLGDLYNAVRSLSIMLSLIEKADVDMHKFGIKIPAG